MIIITISFLINIINNSSHEDDNYSNNTDHNNYDKKGMR